MSNVQDIVRRLTEGDEEDFKDLVPEPWSIRLFHSDGLWNAQLFIQDSPYGVVAQHVDKNEAQRKGAEIALRFNNEEVYNAGHLSHGKRVRHVHTGDLGTVVDLAGPGERWVHWDDDGGDPESRGRHPLDELEPIQESVDDEDAKDMAVGYFDRGAKVRILSGAYKGEPATIQGPFNFGDETGYWVHLDNDSDPHAAITYRVRDLQPLTEGMEDYEPEMLDGPAFQYKDAGMHMNRKVINVLVDGQHIGSLWHELTKGQVHNWHIGYLKRSGATIDIPVADEREGALRLWGDWTGENKIYEAAEDEMADPRFEYRVNEQYPDIVDIFLYDKWLGRVHRIVRGERVGRPVTSWGRTWLPKKFDHPIPDEFNSLEDAANFLWHHWDRADVQEDIRKIVAEATDDDDLDWTKDFVHDPFLVVRSALEHAGFEVAGLERKDDQIVLTFEWAAPTANAKISGWNRAREILEPLIGKLKNGDYGYEHFYRGKEPTQANRFIKMLVRKRLEDDPALWRMEKKNKSAPLDGVTAFWNVLYNGQPLGEVYTTDEGAERLRRELIELHRIVPFHPVGWEEDPGDMWGNGKIIAWWRAHREKLPPELKVGEHYLDKRLLRQD